MKIFNQLLSGSALLVASSLAMVALPLEFATSAGGGIYTNGSLFQTQNPAGAPYSAMMGIDFNGEYNSGTENDWADKFGDRGQFRFELNTEGIVAVDGNAVITPVPVPGMTWAIQNVSSGSVLNSVLRGTIQSISLTPTGTNDQNQTTAWFQAVLQSDGYFHGYGDWNKNGNPGDDVEPLSQLVVGGLGGEIFHSDGLVYVSGLLVQDSVNGNYFHNNVPTDNTLHFSFGVPDQGGTNILLGLGILGLLAGKRMRRRA